MRNPDVFGFSALKGKNPSKRWCEAKLIEDFSVDEDFDSVDSVNKWVHQNIVYTPDVSDNWQLASETYKTKKGDCEDIALLKRALLVNQGFVKEEDIYLILVKDLISRQDHAVLLVYLNEEPFILDSYNNYILPSEDVKDYFPYMSFQGENVWIYGRKAN